MSEINNFLNKIEIEKGIKILFAVETGSRVWKIDSKDSDYDVRFVFVRDIKDYLRIGKFPDVIEGKEEEVDCVGFDIYKFTKLLLTSNPSMIEWLKSDMIYLDDKITKDLFDKFITEKFNPVALYHHYKSMCKQNYLKYLKTKACMTHKKYLYCMRGLINSEYVLRLDKIPPISFSEALDKMKKYIPTTIYTKLKEIIELKKEGFEEVKVSSIHLFEKYIEDFLETEYMPTNRKLIGYSKLQDHIFNLLKV